MAGRPKDSARHKFDMILQSPTGVAKFKRIMSALEDPEIYLEYFKEAANRAWGKSAQALLHQGSDGGPLIIRRIDYADADDSI